MRVLLIAFMLTQLASAGTLVLKRAWVKKFKDRATIDVNFIIDKAHVRPNRAVDDGDLHFAGRAEKEIGLPTVAELVNAGVDTQKQALELIRSQAGSGNSVALSGVWRLWFEHPAHSQIQFAEVPPAANTNPDHSFEVHPVTRIGGVDVTRSFDFIADFEGHEPGKAFAAYEKMRLTVRANASAITLDSPKAVFNYVHFRLRLIGKPKQLIDGGMAAMADVEKDDGSGSDGDEPLAKNIRMIFAPGTAAAAMVKGKQDGDEFDAIAIPRVNLNAVFKAVEAAGTQQFSGRLPYEMIVVGMKPVP